jgi:hypothetical protein
LKDVKIEPPEESRDWKIFAFMIWGTPASYWWQVSMKAEHIGPSSLYEKILTWPRLKDRGWKIEGSLRWENQMARN